MVSPNKLKSAPEIWRLAKDLGLQPGEDPVGAVVRRSVQRVRKILKQFPCLTLAELLDTVAAHLDTVFLEVHADAELHDVGQRYLSRGETAFIDLGEQLNPRVFGLTFRLIRPMHLDRAFVSIIDCRGGKRYRSYFTKWHELAHLLTLTEQRRLKFCRSHEPAERKDPEEALMDAIAGEVGFLPEIVRRHARGHLSLESVDELRERLCPDCSRHAAVLGFAHAWPTPVLLLEVNLALRAADAALADQGKFEFAAAATLVPRAVRVTPNEQAREAGLRIHRNMRVPEASVIYRLFAEGAERLEAEENLNMWSASDGTRLASRPVHVEAFRLNDQLFALINA